MQGAPEAAATARQRGQGLERRGRIGQARRDYAVREAIVAKLRERPDAGNGTGLVGSRVFCTMPKRAHEGTFHKMSPKYLNCYATEFAGKRNIRDSWTLSQITALVAGLVRKRLMYRDLIADSGLPSGPRS